MLVHWRNRIYNLNLLVQAGHARRTEATRIHIYNNVQLVKIALYQIKIPLKH